MNEDIDFNKVTCNSCGFDHFETIYVCDFCKDGFVKTSRSEPRIIKNNKNKYCSNKCRTAAYRVRCEAEIKSETDRLKARIKELESKC